MLLAYADDIVILGESKVELIMGTRKLLESCRKVELRIDENKTKYVIISRKPTILQHFSIGQYLF